MPGRLLRWFRIIVALAMFTGITAAFIDFTGVVPTTWTHTLTRAQFVPAVMPLLTGAGVTLALAFIVIVTLVGGRIYCSAICPLGILQDIVIRIRRLLSSRERTRSYSRGNPVIWNLVLVVTIAAVIAGWGSFALALLDPYSAFGRIASDLFRPLATLANNATVGLTEAVGWPSLFRFDPHWIGWGTMVVPVLTLALIIVLAARHGRLYCNTICPVGAVLGWLARPAAFRLSIQSATCQKCGDCLRACKARCIDLRGGKIDFSRCVACYDCLDVCQHGAVGYRFAWKHPAPAVDELAGNRSPASRSGRALPRRAFLTQSALSMTAAAGFGEVLLARDHSHSGEGRQKHSSGICPPGSTSVERFLDRCTACHLCISACPTGVLQPADLQYGLLGWMKPRLDYGAAFCNFDCRRCGEVCPDGAIDLVDLAVKHVTRIGMVRFNRHRCVVVTNDTDCAACSEHCPTKAVSTVPYGNNLRLPSLNRDLCIGCGACEFACPVKPHKAITVTGLRIHGTAQKLIESKAQMPATTGDFPF